MTSSLRALCAAAALAACLPLAAEAGGSGRDGPRAQSAQHRPAGVNARQHRQSARIRQGVQSGELTRRETRRLAQEQRSIRREERAYRADGTLDRVERRDLQQDLNQASRHINRQKHDEQDRP
jgi:hypothetical protein